MNDRAEHTRCSCAVAVLAGIALCVCCATDTSLHELDGLVRSTGARTVLVEEDLSLYSPFDAAVTRAHRDQVRTQRDLVFGLFELERGAPLCVWLRPDEGLQVEFRVEGERVLCTGIRSEPEEGVYGRAWNDQVVLQVFPPKVLQLPDGRSIEGLVTAETYADTIRHELTHIATSRLGIRADDWLIEGIAHVVEWIPIDGARLRLDPPPERLRQAARIGREQRSVERLLSWEQSVPPTDADRAVSILSCSLVAFALERQPAPTLREGLACLSRADSRELRSLEPAWCAWLERIAATDP